MSFVRLDQHDRYTARTQDGIWGIKCLSQGHSNAPPHWESNQCFATFLVLARHSNNWTANFTKRYPFNIKHQAGKLWTSTLKYFSLTRQGGWTHGPPIMKWHSNYYSSGQSLLGCWAALKQVGLLAEGECGDQTGKFLDMS